MNREKQIQLVNEIREKLKKLIMETDVPALYECYKMADMNLHWAKWLQGEIDEILPELEYAPIGNQESQEDSERLGA
jgi:hypothetical protein